MDCGGYLFHEVQAGDTITSVAVKNGVSIAAIKRSNPSLRCVSNLIPQTCNFLLVPKSNRLQPNPPTAQSVVNLRFTRKSSMLNTKQPKLDSFVSDFQSRYDDAFDRLANELLDQVRRRRI
jgi:hypothetical protein